MKKALLYILGITLLLVVASCREDEEPFASIHGQWQGDKAHFNIKPDGFPIGVPYTVDDFEATMEFQADGTLIITDKDKSTTGSYTINGNDLVINIDFNIEDVNLSGAYRIRELTSSRLKAEIEKNDTVKHPETGDDVSGRVKATLYFNRI